jgi:dipeptidyl aminopeptidase/acylaminoacyl peptidase
MRIPPIFLAALVVSQTLSPGTSLRAQKEMLPQMRGATLLMGWPPYQLELTTENKMVKIQNDEGEWSITPSISADGSIIAGARLLEGQLTTLRVRSTLVISTYSVISGEWTEYKDLTTLSGPVAISPDASRLAYFTWGTDKATWRLRVVDIKNGSTSTLRELPNRVSGMPQISWSPDSRRIAFDDAPEPPVTTANSSDMSKPAVKSKIYVMDLDTGNVREIAEGWLPSWSSSGEWIAFFDYPLQKHNRWPMNLVVPEHINLIRPDGTDSRVVGSWRAPWDDLRIAPVWSPDSKTILINRVRDEGDNMDIYMLDLASCEITMKFKKSPPVYAWVAAR